MGMEAEKEKEGHAILDRATGGCCTFSHRPLVNIYTSQRRIHQNMATRYVPTGWRRRRRSRWNCGISQRAFLELAELALLAGKGGHLSWQAGEVHCRSTSDQVQFLFEFI